MHALCTEYKVPACVVEFLTKHDFFDVDTFSDDSVVFAGKRVGQRQVIFASVGRLGDHTMGRN